MRLMEGLGRPIKDVGFDRMAIVLCQAKGNKDGMVMLLKSLLDALRHQLLHCSKSEQVSKTHRNPTLPHPLFRLAHGVFTVMEDARSQHGVSAALLHAVGQVVEVAYAA